MNYIADIFDRLGELFVVVWFYLWHMGWRNFLLLAVGIPCLAMTVIWLTEKAGVLVSHRR